MYMFMLVCVCVSGLFSTSTTRPRCWGGMQAARRGIALAGLLSVEEMSRESGQTGAGARRMDAGWRDEQR